MIAIRDLQFSWPTGEFELCVETFDVESGTSVALTGPSGSGKTTLLNIIAGILPATSGTIQVGQEQVSQFTERQRRAFRLQNVGLVFQSFELIEYLNVMDNVLLPVRISPALTMNATLRDHARDLLVRVGLERYSRRSVTQLSQGGASARGDLSSVVDGSHACAGR